MNKTLRISAAAFLVALAATPLAQAQTKKELVQRMLTIQRPGIENMARQLAEQPAMQAAQAAAQAIQTRVPPDKREAASKAADAEIRKYIDEAVPITREKAVALASTTIGPMLEEKFTEDELKQLVAWIDSPLNKKYQQLGPDLEKALIQKLVADTRPQIDPKIVAMNNNLAKALGLPPVAAGAAPAPAQARAPAAGASAPAKGR